MQGVRGHSPLRAGLFAESGSLAFERLESIERPSPCLSSQPLVLVRGLAHNQLFG